MRFYITVIGNNPDEQLIAYSVFEAVGIEHQFVKDIDITDEILRSISNGEALEEALGFYGIKHPVSHKSMIDKNEEQRFGYAVVRNGKLIKAVKRTNPMGKFDGCDLGCSRPGIYRLKPHRRGILGESSILELQKMGGKIPYNIADQALKKDIDFETTRKQIGKIAQKQYEEIETIFSGTIPNLQYNWNDPVFNDMSFDEKLERFHDQEAMRIVDNVRGLHRDKLSIFFDIENFQVSKEDYIKRAENNAIVTSSVIKDFVWHEMRTHNWFGINRDFKEEERWCKEFNSILDSASDDELIGIYTCHR